MLEERIVPATFSFSGGVALGMSNFLDNESLAVDFADESTVRFTLSQSVNDSWQAVDDVGPGIDGIGTRTLTVAVSALTGGFVHVGELNSNGLQLTVLGSGFDQPFPFSFQARLHGEFARVNFAGETRFLGGLDISVGHYGNYSFEQTAATNPISFGGPVFVEGGVNFRSAGELRFDHDFTLTGVTGSEAMSIVAEQIVVDANVRTVDPDGPGGVSVTASIQMLAAGEIFLNGTISTGDVESSVPDPTYSVIASGTINLRSGHQYSAPEEFASILGTANGRLVTGNATNTAGGPAYSGSITVESIIGSTQLPAVDAITTGDAITVPVDDQNSFTVSGDIRIHSREGINSSNASGRLSLRTGLAMASTGAGFDDAGYGSLYINDLYDLDSQYSSDIHVTSSAPLRVKELRTNPDLTNIVEIESTSSLLVLELIPYFFGDHVALAGDQISFLATAGGAIEFLGPSSGLAFNIGDGNLNLVAGELRSRWWIGVAPGAVPDTIAGTGTVTIRSASGEGVSLGGPDADDPLPTADLVLTQDFLSAFKEGFSELVFGGADEEERISLAGSVIVHDDLRLVAQEIVGSGRAGTEKSLVVHATRGSIGYSIGDEVYSPNLNAADNVLLKTVGEGRLGDISASIGSTKEDVGNGFELGNERRTIYPQVNVETGPELQHITLSSHAIFVNGSTALEDHLNLVGSFVIADGVLSAPSMNVLGADGIQGGTLRTTSGDLSLHTVNRAIGSSRDDLIVDVAGQLLIKTEAPGGADGDVFIRSTGTILIGGMSTGPDPDVVHISSTGGNVSLGGSVIVNDNVQISSAGTVNLSVPDMQTGSLIVNSQSGVTGTGTVKTTNSSGIVLIAVNGGVGANGVPVNILLENGGKLITTSSGDQFVASTGTVAVDTLGAGSGQINIAGGTFQLTSSDGVSNSSTLAILTGGTLDIQSFDEVVSGLTIDGGQVISSTGTIVSTSGVVLVTTGEASGIGGDQNVEKTGEGGFIFHGDNPTTGIINAQTGSLIFGADATAQNATVTVGQEASVTSTAEIPGIQVGTVAVATFGLVTAGNSPGIFGMKQLQGQPGARMLIEIMGPEAGTGYDQIIVSESATISEMELTILMPDYTPGTNSQFTILDNWSLQPVIGTFAGLPEGSILTVSGVDFRLSYVGGDGNDVVLSRHVTTGPTDIRLSNAAISENEPVGTVVGAFTSTDPDAGNSFSYALVTGDGDSGNGSFTIDGDILKSSEVFDFETQDSYSIRVRSTDQGGLYVEKIFTISVTNLTELGNIDVQLGLNQRSYVRYLDAVFDRQDELQDLLNNNRLQLNRYDLNGANGSTIPLPAYSISGNTIRFDFGVQGIGGNRNSNIGDGYYQLVFDEDGDGQFAIGSPVKSFHRLLGDVNGDGKVDAADKSQVLLANRTTNAESDANGDGIVNLTDVSLTSRAFGRKLKDDLFTDD